MRQSKLILLNRFPPVRFGFILRKCVKKQPNVNPPFGGVKCATRRPRPAPGGGLSLPGEGGAARASEREGRALRASWMEGEGSRCCCRRRSVTRRPSAQLLSVSPRCACASVCAIASHAARSHVSRVDSPPIILPRISLHVSPPHPFQV